MRLLIWLALAFLLLNWFMRAKAAQIGRHPTARSQAPAPAEQMLQCRQCGVHIPASDAVMHASGNAFCCDEHRRRIFPS